jgi:hypothetical protein
MSATCPDCGCGYDVPALNGWRCDACEADALRGTLAEARAWSARWHALAREYFGKWRRQRVAGGFDGDGSLFIERMGPADGGFEVVLRGDWVVTQMADALMHMLDSAKAPNTIECRLTDHKGDGVIVEVRRQHGKTMAMLRDEAERRSTMAFAAVSMARSEGYESGVVDGIKAAGRLAGIAESVQKRIAAALIDGFNVCIEEGGGRG